VCCLYVFLGANVRERYAFCSVHMQLLEVFNEQINDDDDDDDEKSAVNISSGVIPIGQGWTNARGLRRLGSPKPDPKIQLELFSPEIT